MHESSLYRNLADLQFSRSRWQVLFGFREKIADKRRRLIFPDAGTGTVDRGDTIMMLKKGRRWWLASFPDQSPDQTTKMPRGRGIGKCLPHLSKRSFHHSFVRRCLSEV